MSHPTLVRARHDQGLAAYRAGHGVDHVMDIADEIEMLHKLPDLTDEQHREIANSVPSFIAGFLTGLIDDIRSVSKNK